MPSIFSGILKIFSNDGNILLHSYKLSNLEVYYVEKGYINPNDVVVEKTGIYGGLVGLELIFDMTEYAGLTIMPGTSNITYKSGDNIHSGDGSTRSLYVVPKQYSFKHHYRNASLIGTGTYKFRPYTVAEPIVTEDALAGTWIINDTINFSELSTEDEFDFSWFINYNVSGDSRDFVRMDAYRFYQEDEKGNTVLGGGINYVPYSTGIPEPLGAYAFADDLSMWENDSYKTITITSKLSEVENGNILLSWLQANATKQGTSTEILINVSYANSRYNTLNIYDEENGILLETINEEGEYYITTTTGKIFISNEGPAPKYEITEAIGISNVYDETGTEISLSSLPVSSEYTTFLKFDYENESIISFIFNSDN